MVAGGTTGGGAAGGGAPPPLLSPPPDFVAEPAAGPVPHDAAIRIRQHNKNEITLVRMTGPFGPLLLDRRFSGASPTSDVGPAISRSFCAALNAAEELAPKLH